MNLCVGCPMHALTLSRDFSLTFSLSLIRLPYFLADLTSLNQSILYFTGRYHRLLHHWLKRCLFPGIIPLLPIYICNLILDFKIVCSICNKSSSTQFCTTAFICIHMAYPICRIFHINEIAQFGPVFLDITSLSYYDCHLFLR